MDKLEKIDIIKDRLNVSYEKANITLDETDGDLVEALVKLEQEEDLQDETSDETQTNNYYQVKGQKLIDKIKEIIRQGNVNKISVSNNKDETLVEIPVTAGIVSLVIFPYLGILAGLTAMYKEYTLEIERDKSEYYPFQEK